MQKKKNTMLLLGLSAVACIGVVGVFAIAHQTAAISTASAVPVFNVGTASQVSASEESMERSYAAEAETVKWENEAQRLLKANQLEEAESAYVRAYNALPMRGDGRREGPGTLAFVRGDIYLAQRRYHEAIEAYAEGRKTGGARGGGTNLQVALCYLRMGDLESARRYYSEKELLQYDHRLSAQDLPSTKDARSLEASILAAIGSGETVPTSDYAERLSYYKKALALAPDNGWLQYNAGKALHDLNRDEEAQPYFRKAVKMARGDFAKDAKEKIENWEAWQKQQRDGVPVQQTVSAAELQAQKDSFERGANGWKKDYEDSLKRMTPAQRQVQEESMRRLVEEWKAKQP